MVVVVCIQELEVDALLVEALEDGGNEHCHHSHCELPCTVRTQDVDGVAVDHEVLTCLVDLDTRGGPVECTDCVDHMRLPLLKSDIK